MPFPAPSLFRKKPNWLIALAVEAAAPILHAWARSKTGPASHPAQWRKALIIGDNHIGDLLYRSASLEHLKSALPQCEFHYLTAPGSAQVLEGNPALTSILPWQKSDSPLDLTPEQMSTLRAMRFDAALSTNCVKYWPELLLAIRLGIPNRVGYTYKGFSAWVTRPIPIRLTQPFAAYFRDYVAALTGRPPHWSPRPVIHTNAADQSAADALFARLNLATHPHITAAFLTSRQPTGIWPPEKFGQALAALRRGRSTHILLCGAASDEPLLTRIDREFDLHADIIPGALSIRALVCFLRRVSVVLTTDSGPRHLSNAAGARAFFIRNTYFDPVEAGPYVDTETDLCPIPTPGHSGDSLLASIDPDHVATILSQSAI